jgi:pyruvate/2-oxoglutarate dehydrogenase complex dihydrolipoamide dehydrogenase (E3) component
MGVDVIIESGEFCRFPQQAFVLPNKKLSSHTYLIATGSIPLILPIISLSEVGFQAQRSFL